MLNFHFFVVDPQDLLAFQANPSDGQPPGGEQGVSMGREDSRGMGRTIFPVYLLMYKRHF